MRLRFGGRFECFFWQCIASSVTIWPATLSSSSSFCTAGISLDFSSISICASTNAVSAAKALSICLALASLNASKLPFAVKRQYTRTRGRFAAIQVCCVLAKYLLDIRWIQPLQNITDRRVGGWSLPANLESFVQPFPVRLDERTNASVRIGSSHNRQNGKQQNIRQLIEFTLGAARVADHPEVRKKGIERLRGNLP